MSGYGNARVTPYMHIMCYHIPHFLKADIPLKRFTGQGIEKINDIVRSIYHNKSNKHDACCEALQAIKRIDSYRVMNGSGTSTPRRMKTTGEKRSSSEGIKGSDLVLHQEKTSCNLKKMLPK